MEVVSRYQELVTGGPEGCQGCSEGEDNVLHSPVTKAEEGVIIYGRGFAAFGSGWLLSCSHLSVQHH